MNRFLTVVPPTAPRDLSIDIVTGYSSIWLTLKYKRPSDDGGTDNLDGYLTKCRVGEGNSKVLFDCTKELVILGNKNESQTTFLDLKGKTRYYFSMYFQSKTNQNGAEASIYYTTPSVKSLNENLSGGVIAGIVIGGLVFLCIAGIVVYVILKRVTSGSPLGASSSVAYGSTDPE